MKLYAFSSTEELLEKVDVLCVPASKERAEYIYQDLLTRIIHADSLPPLTEFLAMKASPAFFFGQWNGHRVKVVYWCEAEKLTEANTYSLAKKMAIKVRTDCPGKSGLWLPHLNTTALVQSAFAGWTAGQYDLGLYKQTDHAQPRSALPELFALLGAGIEESIARDGITIGLVQQEVMNLVNTPASHKSPAYLGAWAARSAAQYGYTATILDKQDLTTLGMHALLAVNRFSIKLPHAGWWVLGTYYIAQWLI